MAKNDSYFDSKEFRTYLQQYQKMLQGGQRVYFDADTLVDIAEYYDSIRRKDLADQCIDYARKLHPDADSPKIFMAGRCLDSGDLHGAEQQAQSITEKDTYEFFLLQGEILLYKMDMENADAYWNNALQQIDDENRQNFLVDVAATYLDYEYPNRALRWLNRISPDQLDRRCLQLEAECLVNQERYERACEVLKALIDSDPYDTRAWVWQADAQLALDKYDEAIESCDFALAIDAQCEQAYRIKGCALEEQRQLEKAHECYNRYLQLDDENAIMHMVDGLCLLGMDQPFAALQQLKQAGTLMQQQGGGMEKIYLPLASAYGKTGNLECAFEYVEKARHAGYDAADTQLAKAGIFLDNGRLAEGLTILMELLRDEQTDNATDFKIAIVMFEHQRYNLAMMLFKALTKDPAFQKDCYAYMAYIFREEHKKDDYLRYLSLACTLAPKTALAVFCNDFPGIPVKDYPTEARRRLADDFGKEAEPPKS